MKEDEDVSGSKVNHMAMNGMTLQVQGVTLAEKSEEESEEEWHLDLRGRKRRKRCKQGPRVGASEEVVEVR